MRRFRSTLFILSVILILGMTACSENVTSAPADAHPEYDTVLYFSAHQDDEILEDFGGILQDLREGKAVHVILLSDGAASGVYKSLLKEGFDLTREDFSAARDREFKDALIALGVSEENIHFLKDRLGDGTLPDHPEEIEAAILYYLRLYPGAAVRTHMYKLEGVKNHKDHTAVGDAAVRLYEKGALPYLRLFIDPWVHEDCEKAGIRMKKLPEGKLSVEELHALEGAVAAYAFNDPENGRYGIGNRSVSYWELIRKDPVSYCIDYNGSR